MPYLLVGLGGFLGANARFLAVRLSAALFDTRFPAGTFLVNVLGSLLLGALGAVVAQKVTPATDTMRLAIGVGFLGAFTTFSTFELETHALLEDGTWVMAALYVAASVLAGLVALRAGVLLARGWLV